MGKSGFDQIAKLVSLKDDTHGAVQNLNFDHMRVFEDFQFETLELEDLKLREFQAFKNENIWSPLN